MRVNVRFTWDDEACVWTATSSEVPGLVLEGGSFDALLERVRIAVPEMLKLNGTKAKKFKLSYKTTREDAVPVYG